MVPPTVRMGFPGSISLIKIISYKHVQLILDSVRFTVNTSHTDFNTDYSYLLHRLLPRSMRISCMLLYVRNSVFLFPGPELSFTQLSLVRT